MNYPYFNPYFNPNQQPTVNQNFTLANNNNELDGKIAENIDAVKNTLALKTTLFIDTPRKNLWIKDATGNIKIYELKEVIEKDAKDEKIEKLEKELEEIKGALLNVRNANANVNESQPANGGATTPAYGNGRESTNYIKTNNEW